MALLINKNVLTRSRITALCCLFAIASFGCSPITTAYFLFKGDGKKEATYKLDPIEKDRKEIRLLVMASNGPGLDWEFAGLDREVASETGKQLAQGSKTEKNPFVVTSPEAVDRFKQQHPNWRTMHPSEIAKEVQADYVIDISVLGINLYQPGTGKIVYEGNSQAQIMVYQSGVKQVKYEYTHNTTQHPRSADSIPVAQYKTELVKRFGYEIACRHMKHAEDNRVAPLRN